MLRAGLLSLILFAFIGLVACAPVPERLSNLVERYDDSGNNLFTRSLDAFEDPVYSKRDYLLELEGRDLGLHFSQYFKRDYDFDLFDERDFDDFEHNFAKRDIQVLERRSIFTKIKHAFQHVGHAIAHVVQKVGHFVKTTGAKIAKFGLKVVAAAASVASKVVKFIPGVGTAAGMALKGVAMGVNKASDKIHANLGKLGKIDKGLNNVINPLGSAAKHMGKGGKVLGALF